jgi:hypothetical protein
MTIFFLDSDDDMRDVYIYLYLYYEDDIYLICFTLIKYIFC